MKIHLKKLCPSDGDDNAASGNQTGLVDGWRVPQTIYWLFIDGKPVGYGKIRHILTDKLLADGGTIGYSIRPGQRNKGFGKILLSELIKECSDMGIEKALLTIHKNNTASIKTALDNHGVIEKSSDTLHYIWIRCC